MALLFAAIAPAFGQNEDSPLSAEERAAGWKSLFDGKTAPGFRGLQKREFLKAGWVIQNGALVLPKSVRQSGTITGGDLVTIEQFDNFELRFAFKLTASADSGILYFARGGPGGKPTGHEYQIVDDVHHPDGLKGGPVRRTGSLYGVLAPAESKVLKSSDQWNTGGIVVRGNHVEHWLNEAKVLEYDCNSRALMEAVRDATLQVPGGFGVKIKSSLVILDQGEEVAFRNIRIRPIPLAPLNLFSPLTATPAPATPTPAPVRATPPPATPTPKHSTLPPPPPPPVFK